MSRREKVGGSCCREKNEKKKIKDTRRDREVMENGKSERAKEAGEIKENKVIS